MPRRKKPSAAKRKLQKNLYDFHTSIVFSIAPSEGPQPVSLDDAAEQRLPSSAETPLNCPQEPEIAIIELPPLEEADPYVVAGLPRLDRSVFHDMFEFDWIRSDVERIVRDAVERKRIKAILGQWYRVLVLFFRHHAGKAALLPGGLLGPNEGFDLMQVPNRLSLLEDLNVQCVDPAKYGVTETSLRRDGLIAFVLHTARMVAAHSSEPARFRMFAAEGIETSEAVRSLMVDHVAVYAQIQDASHFRELFLLDHHDRQARRLRHLLRKHEANISNFFFEVIMAATTAAAARERARGRANSYRTDGAFTSTSTTMSFPTFISTLKTIGVIPPPADARTRSRQATAEPDVNKGKKRVDLDESRVMRVFQQCLDVTAELNGSSAGVGSAVTRQQLAYPQFVEALLRVTLLRNETAICRGGFDICPGQHTSAVCRCRDCPPGYDLSAFGNAIEDLFVVIGSLRSQQSRRRSVLKTTTTRALRWGQGDEPPRRPHQRHHALIVEPDVCTPLGSRDKGKES